MPLVGAKVPKTMDRSSAQWMPMVKESTSQTKKEEPREERETLRNSYPPDVLKTMFLPSGEKEN